MITLPPHHQWVETQDGSLTLFSERFQEACHSTTGARSETLLHYIQGCQVLERVGQHPDFTILEVGFGLGLGFLTTKDALKDHQGRWQFISLEMDRDLVTWFLTQEKLEHDWDDHVVVARGANFTLTVIVGDARLTLEEWMRNQSVQWHAIYQDAFSPRRNPHLWTVEWFTLLKQFSAPDAILSTYSASSSIRKSLHESGWKLQRGDKFGPKRSSTRAFLSGDTDPEILLHLRRSPVSALTDDNADAFLQK